jgi:hypothetical protein
MKLKFVSYKLRFTIIYYFIKVMLNDFIGKKIMLVRINREIPILFFIFDINLITTYE